MHSQPFPVQPGTRSRADMLGELGWLSGVPPPLYATQLLSAPLGLTAGMGMAPPLVIVLAVAVAGVLLAMRRSKQHRAGEEGSQESLPLLT